jgi:hypothetical protein
MKPIISIVVPTKNRYYYLEFLILYFHSIDSKKIELVIQDNSDIGTNNNFSAFIESLNDSRISYQYSGESMTIDQNCDLALNRAKGDYISMIGDDDAFSKHIINYIEDFKNNDLDAVLTAKSSFTWPDVKPRFYKEKLSGIFRVEKFNSKKTEIDVTNEMIKVISIGGTEMLNLPRTYHGIIKKAILEEIYLETGTYFPGPSPDMANAISSCKFIKKFMKIDLPLIISGHSNKSAGGQGAIGKHIGEISEIKFLPKATGPNWSKQIPFYWSGYTIYAESVIQALKRTNNNDFLKSFNLEYLLATCFVFDKDYKDRIIVIFNNLSLIQKLKIGYYYLFVWAKRLNYHLKSNLGLLFPSLLSKNSLIYKMDNILDVANLNDKIIENNIEQINNQF